MPWKVVLWLGLMLSILCALLNGFGMGFNVYALDVKQAFYLSQTQVEILASMYTFGTMIGILQTVLMRKLGFSVTFAMIWATASAASGLYSLCVHYRDVVHSYPYIIYCIQFILSGVLYMLFVTASGVCVRSFPQDHTGKLVGVFTAVTSLGKILFCALLELIFPNDLAAYFLTVCVLCASFIGMSFPILYHIEKGKETQIDDWQTTTDSKNREDSPLCQQNHEIIGFGQILRSWFFHGMFWSSVIFFGCTHCFIINITSIAESVGVSQPLLTVYVVSGSCVLVRFFCGFVFDRFASVFCGLTMLLFSCIIFLVAVFSVMFVGSPTVVFVAASLTGAAQGICVPILVSLLLLRFGRHHYGAITIAFYTLGGAFQIVFQLMFGFLYDAGIDSKGWTDHVCYGTHCFYRSFVVFFALGISFGTIYLVSFCVLWKRERHEIT